MPHDFDELADIEERARGSKQVQVRVPPRLQAELDAWIDRQPDPKPTLPEALPRLARKALTCEAAQGAEA
jgi:hypothetical protein